MLVTPGNDSRSLENPPDQSQRSPAATLQHSDRSFSVYFAGGESISLVNWKEGEGGVGGSVIAWRFEVYKYQV